MPSTSTRWPSHGGVTGALTSVCSVRKYSSPSYSASQHGTDAVSRTIGQRRSCAARPARRSAASGAASSRQRCTLRARRRSHSALRKLTRSLLLLLGVADVVAAIVEVDELAQRRGRAVREIRRARREPAELLHDDRADVVALAGDQRAARDPACRSRGRGTDAARTSALHVTLNSGSCGFAVVHGFSGASRAHGRFVVPMSIQPLATSMPVMCMPWQVAHVRLTGLPRPTRVQVHRVADPERAEHEHVVAARDRLARRVAARRSASRAAARQLRPRVAQRKHVARRVVAEHAGRRRPRDCAGRSPAGRPARRGCRPRRSRDLRRVDLLLERRRCRASCVGVERRAAAARCVRAASAACVFSVGTRASAIRFMLVGQPVSGSRDGRQAVLADERADAEVLVRHVLRVGDGPRAAVHRDRRAARLCRP